jgi:hypothetical protein
MENRPHDQGDGMYDPESGIVPADFDSELVDQEPKKSSFTNEPGGVVTAVEAGMVAMRDGKDESGRTLVYNAAEWAAFIRGAKSGEFDFPPSTSNEDPSDL